MNSKEKTKHKVKNCTSIIIFVCIYILTYKMIVASAYRDKISSNSISRLIKCIDAFDDNQCIFMEDAIGALLRKFDEKLEDELLVFQREKIESKREIDEMKLQIEALTQQFSIAESDSPITKHIDESIDQNRMSRNQLTNLKPFSTDIISKRTSYKNDKVDMAYHPEHSWSVLDGPKTLAVQGLLNLSSVSIV